MRGATVFLGVAILVAAFIVSGNGLALAGMGIILLVLLALGALASGTLNWLFKRSDKKRRFWLQGIFDNQLDQLRFRMEQDGRAFKPHALEFSHLRWWFSISDYFFRDLSRFKDRGVPILLTFPKGADRPRLLLGVSEVGNGVVLGEGTVFNPNQPRTVLSAEEIQTLKENYPNISGHAFNAVHVFCREDDDELAPGENC